MELWKSVALTRYGNDSKVGFPKDGTSCCPYVPRQKVSLSRCPFVPGQKKVDEFKAWAPHFTPYVDESKAWAPIL